MFLFSFLSNSLTITYVYEAKNFYRIYYPVAKELPSLEV